jgi:outer membrane protein TolC
MKSKYMKISLGIILIIMLFTAPAIFAEAELVLTWDDCVKQAVKSNPELVSAQEALKQSEADKRITQSAALPDISVGMQGSTSDTASQPQTDSYSYSLTGRQLLFDGFKTSKDIDEAQANISAFGYNYAVVSSDVRLDLRTAFVELLRAQELISLTTVIAERREQNLELVNLRYEAGREHKGSLLTAEADLARAQFEITRAERSVSLAQRQLVKGLGFDKGKPIKVTGPFAIQEEYEAKPDLASLADTTPFLKELIAQKEASRFNLESAKADFFPRVFLNSQVGRSSSDWPPDGSEWSAGVSVSVPLFEGGSRIAGVSKAKSRVRQAEADERSGRDSVLVTLEGAWKDFQDTVANLTVQKKFLHAAEERAKIARAQYENGLISFDDWIIIEDNLVNARKSYLNAQADVMLAEAAWIQAQGGTIEHDQK